MTFSLALSGIGVIVAIIGMCYLCYKGAHPLLAYPVMCIIIFLTSGISVVDGIFTIYAGEFGKQAIGGCFLFTTACMFARTMVNNKSAYKIADFLCSIIDPKWGPIVILLVSGILATIGLSVGTWALMYPIALVVFSKGNYSEDLIFTCVLFGSTTWSNGFPGGPTTINAIACQALGVAPTDAMIPGIIGTAVMIVLQCVYVIWIGRRWAAKGRGFTEWKRIEAADEQENKDYPSIFVAIAPVLVVLVLFNFFKLSLPISMIGGTLAATLVTIRQKTLKGWWNTWQTGFLEGTGPMLQICVKGALGAVLAATPIYNYILDNVGGLNMHPYLVFFFAAAIVSAVVGGTTAAVAIILPQVDAILSKFPGVVVDRGNIMRIVINSASGLDKMPHNATCLAVMEMFNTDFKRSYPVSVFPGIIAPVLGGLACTLASFIF